MSEESSDVCNSLGCTAFIGLLLTAISLAIELVGFANLMDILLVTGPCLRMPLQQTNSSRNYWNRDSSSKLLKIFVVFVSCAWSILIRNVDGFTQFYVPTRSTGEPTYDGDLDGDWGDDTLEVLSVQSLSWCYSLLPPSWESLDSGFRAQEWPQALWRTCWFAVAM
ncbi:hypothetical protein EDB85DRAFT_1892990 [Lactarius pseudohatsudake]|nr:hypothetical protein EDB85DRAFT_1893843 [Lactarius pseudohatsudake]KAH9027414.1 hypothetical protein EDB85DRAFT_1892990 [Lactarius pseudohatsudake]